MNAWESVLNPSPERVAELRERGLQLCGCCAGIEWGGEYPVECSACAGSGVRPRRDARGRFLGRLDRAT